MAKMLKKISTKTAIEVNDFKTFKEVTPVLRVAGVVRKAVVGIHPQYGEFYKFLGNFVAMDLRTGMESNSGTAFLPAPLDGMIAAALVDSEGKQIEGNIEFAVDISVKPREDLAVGYEYLVDNLMEVKRSEPMENLLKSLPAPKIVRHDLLENLDDPKDAQTEEPAHRKAKKA